MQEDINNKWTWKNSISWIKIKLNKYNILIINID